MLEGQMPEFRRELAKLAKELQQDQAGLTEATRVKFWNSLQKRARDVIASAAQLFPTGDLSGTLVAQHQPATLAAMEGLFETTEGAGLIILGQPNVGERRLDNSEVRPYSWPCLCSATAKCLSLRPPRMPVRPLSVFLTIGYNVRYYLRLRLSGRSQVWGISSLARLYSGAESLAEVLSSCRSPGHDSPAPPQSSNSAHCRRCSGHHRA